MFIFSFKKPTIMKTCHIFLKYLLVASSLFFLASSKPIIKEIEPNTYAAMMGCVTAMWNAVSECISVSNLAPDCASPGASVTEWRDEFGTWSPLPASGQLCGCDVYEYLDVTPVCDVKDGNFILGGRQFNKCPGRCLTRTDFTFPQGSSNIVNYPACSQNLNCIEITPSQLLANGGAMTAYYRSNTPSGTVVTILRFTYNGLGLNCANINAQVVQRGTIYKHIFIRRTVTCGGGITEVCNHDIDIPQVPDNCLLEAFIGTVNLSAPCNAEGFAASTINLALPATYQWKYNGINVTAPDPSAPNFFCLSGRPYGSYCAMITDNAGCMTEVCRIHQAGCTVGVTISTSGNLLIASVTNCGPYMASFQWSRWDGVSWTPTGTNSNVLNTGGLAGDFRVMVTCGPCSTYGNIVIPAPLLGPLPVILQKFEAETKLCINPILHWKTLTEVNSRAFVIERSNDGKVYENIGNVPSNNKSTGSEYTYNDISLESDKNVTLYYRLRHYDFDGTENIHQVIKVHHKCKQKNASLVINPNPTSGIVHISSDGFYGDDINIKIFSSKGDLVKTLTIQNKAIAEINLAALPAGIYHIEVFDNFEKISQTFSKVD